MPRTPAPLYACLLGLCALLPGLAGKPRRPRRPEKLCSAHSRGQASQRGGERRQCLRAEGAFRALPGGWTSHQGTAPRGRSESPVPLPG